MLLGKIKETHYTYQTFFIIQDRLMIQYEYTNLGVFKEKKVWRQGRKEEHDHFDFLIGEIVHFLHLQIAHLAP